MSNLASICVFLKSGIKDSVTTLLFSLAISDVTFLVLISPTAATYVIFHFAPTYDWPFQTNLTFFLLYWPAFTMYDFSAYISISAGVMRCACVAMPLRFKSMFTRSRTVKLVPALFLLAVLLRTPVLTMFYVAYVRNPLTNRTRVHLLSKNVKILTQINDLLNRKPAALHLLLHHDNLCGGHGYKTLRSHPGSILAHAVELERKVWGR
ncbi:hypothetical protein EGW08_001086 [Elysia chlorotica]|uniref:G-protein coupled receptors family 1 profile domain-containing protein n=1 Tax=Elysia chlorotica TaxID=188477 RepID=A0A433UBS7_ELYCH|nr:hypothetical protein EGW08_001086 [Elysia chlorotica]